MSMQSYRKFLLPALCVLLLTPLLGPVSQWLWAGQSDGVISLQAPPFVNVASAQGGTSFIDQEAGIAAYLNAGRAIDLSQVERLYDSRIDVQTDQYILGSIAVPITAGDANYSDNFDVKLYMHVDGWIMAYYHKSEPVSKIFDWRNWDGTGNLPTMLQTVLDVASSEVAGITFDPTYYHFNFPDANSMSLIADESYNPPTTESFEVTLPSSFTYYERSWAVGGANTSSRNDDFSVDLQIDGIDVGSASVIRARYGFSYGTITQGQFLPDELHTVTATQRDVSGTYLGNRQFFGLALVYQVP